MKSSELQQQVIDVSYGTPERSSAVPEVGDPIWEKLLGGSIHIDIRFLSLKLLLTKLRKHVTATEDSGVRRLRVMEIHRYLSRNEHVLEYELKQLQLLRSLSPPPGQEKDE